MKPTHKPRRPDFLLSIPVVILLGLGMVMVYSASDAPSKALYGEAHWIFVKQMIALGLGCVVLLATIVVPHHLYRKKAVLWFGILVVTALLVGVLFQTEAKGAHRWYYIGSFGFQPSDLAKVLLIVLVAAVCAAHDNHAMPWRRRLVSIVPIMVLFSALILAQPDFGTTMILLAIAGVMLFLAGMPTKILLMGGLFLLPLMAGLLATENYRLQRILDFVSPTESYQTRQARYAIGSGGLTGVGLGKSTQKLHYLPEPHTDFIFATLGEELGFMGSFTVIACFIFFLWRGAIVLKRIEDPYSRLLGAGLLVLLIMQAFINISVALNLFPNKGLTLPFMSAGGTSLIMSLGIFGVILNISRWQVMGNRVAV